MIVQTVKVEERHGAKVIEMKGKMFKDIRINRQDNGAMTLELMPEAFELLKKALVEGEADVSSAKKKVEAEAGEDKAEVSNEKEEAESGAGAATEKPAGKASGKGKTKGKVKS